MVSKFLPKSNFTVAQRFFTEKLMELFLSKTIDSHRVKLNNPKWILSELHQVLSDWHLKKIKHFDKTVMAVTHEAIRFLSSENELLFKSVDKNYYKGLLGKASQDQYLQLSYATKLVLVDNEKYCLNIFDKIEAEIAQLDAKARDLKVEDLENLSRLCDYIASDLLNLGFSKGYLLKLISTEFGGSETPGDFKNTFQNLRLLSERPLEKFTVVFRLKRLRGGGKKIELKSPHLLNEENVNKLKSNNEASKGFFEKKILSTFFVGIDEEGKDYLSVIEKAKKALLYIIDLLHLGFPDDPFDFERRCLVVGTKDPSKAKVHNCFHETDGQYRNNQKLYDQLAAKVEQLIGKKEIQEETKLKIISALRHLRLGRDADELEQKFINYWIGLEYVFSNYDTRDNNTITRLKKYFSFAHLRIYVRRNLHEFHKDIARLNLKNEVANYDDDLMYLKHERTYIDIVSKFLEKHPLLAFRAFKNKNLVSDSKSLAHILTKHDKNLDWHLTRSYRIRNEIVHDAAIHLNIDLVTGNLKYYLTFVLYSIIDYLDNTPADMNMDGKICIEDFLILQEIRYDSLKNEGFNFESLMNEKSVTEMFS